MFLYVIWFKTREQYEDCKHAFYVYVMQSVQNEHTTDSAIVPVFKHTYFQI